MNTTTPITLSTAAASSSVSLSFIVLIQWLLSSYNIQMPADVAAASATLLTAAVHYLLAIKLIPTGSAAPVVTPVAPVVTPTVQ